MNETNGNFAFAIAGIVLILVLMEAMPKAGGWLLLIVVFGMLLVADRRGYLK